MGERFIDRNRLHGNEWFERQQREYLKKFEDAGIEVGRYDPKFDPDATGVRLAKGWLNRLKSAQAEKSISIDGKESPGFRAAQNRSA